MNVLEAPPRFVEKVYSAGKKTNQSRINIPIVLAKKYGLEPGTLIILQEDPITKRIMLIPAVVVPK